MERRHLPWFIRPWNIVHGNRNKTSPLAPMSIMGGRRSSGMRQRVGVKKGQQWRTGRGLSAGVPFSGVGTGLCE